MTFESRRGERMFERYGFRVMNRSEITKYKAFYPESVYLSTVIKNLEVGKPFASIRRESEVRAAVAAFYTMRSRGVASGMKQKLFSLSSRRGVCRSWVVPPRPAADEPTKAIAVLGAASGSSVAGTVTFTSGSRWRLGGGGYHRLKARQTRLPYS